jgi:serine/threonine protein kinase
MTASENDDPLASFLKNKASDKKMSDFKLMKENPKVPGNAILAKDKTNGELVVIKTLHNLMNKY